MASFEKLFHDLLDALFFLILPCYINNQINLSMIRVITIGTLNAPSHVFGSWINLMPATFPEEDIVA